MMKLLLDENLFFAAGINTYLSTSLAARLKNETDVLVTYTAPNGDYNWQLTSRHLKALTYHELGHASHFMQAGCGYWQDYRTRVANEIAFGSDPDTKPYGDRTETNAGVVGLGEMWGSHCEYIFINRHYGNGSGAPGFVATIQALQFFNLQAPPFGNGLNAYLNAIENFDPNRNEDVLRWIPMGLPYDLIDNRNDNAQSGGPVIDNVAGYTTGQCFNALQSDVRTVPAFRNRLLQQNSNNQQTQVNELFTQYNY